MDRERWVGGAAGEDTATRTRLAPRRGVLVAVAVLAFAVAAAGVFEQRKRGAIPADLLAEWNRAPEDAYTVAVPGRGVVLATAPSEVAFLAQRESPGTRITVDGREVVLQEELPPLAFLGTLLSVLCYAAVVALVLAPRAGQPGALALYWSLMLVMLANGAGGVYPPQPPFGRLRAFNDLVALCAFPVLFLRAALTFPRPAPGGARAGRAFLVLVVAAVGIAVWNLVLWNRRFDDASSVPWGDLETPTHAIEALLVVGMGLGCVALWLSGRHAELARERAQAKWLLWGIAVAATPFVFLRALPRLLFRVESPVTPAVDRLVEICTPLAFAIAVVKHRLFDIDVIIRRSLIYTSLAVLLVGVFLAASFAAGAFVTTPDSWASRLLWGLAFAIPAAAFLPTRRWLGRWVDRSFFRLRHEHGRAIDAVEPALAGVSSQAEAARVVHAAVVRALEPKRCGVLVRGGDADHAEGNVPLGALRAACDATRDGAPATAPEATSLPETERPWPPALAAAGVRVAQPLVHAGVVLGVVVVGEKASERRYVEEDLAFLSRTAVVAARAVDRLGLVQRAAEEAMARRSLAALDKEKSDFLTKVAHDLRTPLAGVRWSAQNVVDGLTGPVNDEQAATLRAIDAAAGRLQRLVDNLLDMSRLKAGAPPTPAADVDLPGLAAEVARSLEVSAAAKRVAIRLPAADGLPPVRGDRDRLSQVLANLIDNAIKYSPPGGEVDLRTDRDGDGWVRLTVRDRGPGLPEDAREALFDLFRQGTPSPHGGARGFGIGLHVVKSWTEAAGGSVAAGNHPEGGAVFTCRFPAAGRR